MKEKFTKESPRRDLKGRTQSFALAIIRLVEVFSHQSGGRVIGNQLMRSATSVGANYRAAARARSRAEFISKIRVVEEEADECGYWLELADKLNMGEGKERARLLNEAGELTAIFVASSKTASAHGKK